MERSSDSSPRAHVARRSGAASRRGGALLASLMLVIVIAGMGVVMVQMHAAQTRRQVAAIDDKRALYIAEAGLAEAFLAVSEGKSGSVGTADEPAAFGDGVFWVEATELEDGQVSLRSTGLCGVGRFCVQVALQRHLDPLASLGVFSNVDLVVGEGAIVDGYDSRDGSFEEQLDADLPVDSTGEGARVTSNGDVVLEGEAAGGLIPGVLDLVGLGGDGVTFVLGDAQPGPLGAVSAESGVVITGATTPAQQPTSLPAIAVPTEGRAPNFQYTRGNTSVTLGQSQFLYEQFTVPESCTLNVTGPAVLTVGELVLESDAQLVCDTTDGQIEIYVSDYLAVKSGAQIVNTTADPMKLALLVNASEWLDRDADGLPDAPVVFEPGGTFHGYLYAPGADVTIPSTVRFFGGAAANSLALAPGARVTFDRALSDIDLTLAGLPKLIAWRIVELPRTELVSLRVDPIRKLTQDGIVPKKSSVSHVDEFLRVEYFDASGNVQVYEGEAKNFLWSAVKKTIKTVWDDDPVVDGV